MRISLARRRSLSRRRASRGGAAHRAEDGLGGGAPPRPRTRLRRGGGRGDVGDGAGGGGGGGDLGAGSDGDRPSDGRHRRRRGRRVLEAPPLLILLHRVRGVADLHDGRAGAESGTPGLRAIRPAGEVGRVSLDSFGERRAQFLRVHHPPMGVARRTGRVLAARKAATALTRVVHAAHGGRSSWRNYANLSTRTSEVTELH